MMKAAPCIARRLILLPLTLPLIAHAGNIEQELRDGFEIDIRQQTSLTHQKPANHPDNQDNQVFTIPRNKATIEFRPDLHLAFRQVDLSIKPRASWVWSRWQGENREETETYINEWRVRAELHEKLFLSWGRENLQWGPGWLFSPSNPFFVENGRSNPNQEIPGMDFARLVYLPNWSWSISLISHLDEGHQPIPAGQPIKEQFEKTHALKVDYNGQAIYAGLVVSSNKTTDTTVGGFVNWTVNDATLLYTDFSFDRDQELILLAGASYTLESGPTFAVETTREERNKQLMLQYSQNDILQRLNLVLRATHNLSTHSDQLLGIAEVVTGDHSQLFLNVMASEDGEVPEAVIDYRVIAGLSYVF